MLICFRLLIQAIISGMQLKVDIETNPGPAYILEKIVHGSIYQGNSQLFGKTAGFQCACNGLYALCWTKIKQIFHWVRRELCHILVESVDQLPAYVKMYNYDIPVQYLRLETQLATLINGDSFLRDLLTT